MTYKIISAKRLNNGAGGSSIFTKSGNVRKDCKITWFEGTPEEAKEYLNRIGFVATGTPYIFTYISGEDALGNRCIVRQYVNGVITSPLELAQLLGVHK